MAGFWVLYGCVRRGFWLARGSTARGAWLTAAGALARVRGDRVSDGMRQSLGVVYRWAFAALSFWYVPVLPCLKTRSFPLSSDG